MKKLVVLLVAVLVLIGLLFGLASVRNQGSDAGQEPQPSPTEPPALQSEAEYRHLEDTGEPVVHCQTDTETGYYEEVVVGTEKAGEETRFCAHDVQGAHDIRYQYLDHYQGHCTLCPHTSSFYRLWWGDWKCVAP